MNAEKVYASATAALRGIINEISDPNQNTQKLYDSVLNEPEAWKAKPFLYELGKLAREAKEEIVSKGGKKDQLAACKAIVKTAYSEILQGAWIDKEGWQVVCDGYRAVRMKEPIDALPTAQGTDIDRLLESARGNSVEMKLPTIVEVKAAIASQKSSGNKRFLYDFGEDKPAVDAKFLLDMLKLGLDDTAMISSKAPMISAIYMRGEGVEALLLPVRKPKVEEEEEV